MSDLSSPSQLVPATPKRAPGVKRLNSVPKLIGAAVVVVFIGGVLYTAVLRHEASVAEQKVDDAKKKVEGGHPPAFLTREAHGEVANAALRPTPHNPPPPQPGAAPAATSTPALTTDQPEPDVVEKARARAWEQYYQQLESLQAKRYEMAVRAITGGDAQQGVHMAGETTAMGQSAVLDSPTGISTPSASASSQGYSTGGVDPEGQTGKQAFLKTRGDPLGLDEDLAGSVHGPLRDGLVAILAAALGVQNATARGLAVPDLTTTVLTLTITGIAADARAAGGSGSRAGRRLISVAAMLGGAVVGAVLILRGQVTAALGVAVILMAAIVASTRWVPRWAGS